MSVSDIVRGIMRVEQENAARRYATRDGRYPCCKNALGTMSCERCGADVTTMRGKPCPGVPEEQRWDVRRIDERSDTD